MYVKVFTLVSITIQLLTAVECGLWGSPPLVKSSTQVDELFELPIVHYNDFHARFEQTSWSSNECNSTTMKCVGGFARLYTAVMDALEGRENAILLNAGDNFQGTLWYNLYKWNVTVEFMNMLPHDAMGLGNHEFDDKIQGVLPYLTELNCPVLAANIDDTDEPDFKDKYQEYIIINRGGQKIGIVGYMLSTTNEISSTENLRFTDEIEAVNRVTKQLKDQDVEIIIALSHSGIDVDQDVAENCPDVDVIVGGHSHTLLYTGTPPGDDWAFGNYPLVVTQASGHRVLIVQASAYTKYLGNLTVFFNAAGEVDSYEGNPILLDESIVEDPMILEKLAPWKEGVDDLAREVIGSTLVLLNQSGGACATGECNIGNLITDAMVYEYLKDVGVDGSPWTSAPIAATNSGGIRTSINEIDGQGIITFGALATAQPFQNTMDVCTIQGKYILEAMEFSVSRSYGRNQDARVFSGVAFLQWSGVRVTFDMNRRTSNRVLPNVEVLCNDCRVPTYEPLDLERYYQVVLNSFLSGGGDAYVVFRDNCLNKTIGRLDTDILREYIQQKSPITHGLEGRIIMIQSSSSTQLIPGLSVMIVTLMALFNRTR